MNYKLLVAIGFITIRSSYYLFAAWFCFVCDCVCAYMLYVWARARCLLHTTRYIPIHFLTPSAPVTVSIYILYVCNVYKKNFCVFVLLVCLLACSSAAHISVYHDTIRETTNGMLHMFMLFRMFVFGVLYIFCNRGHRSNALVASPECSRSSNSKWN